MRARLVLSCWTLVLVAIAAGPAPAQNPESDRLLVAGPVFPPPETQFDAVAGTGFEGADVELRALRLVGKSPGSPLPAPGQSAQVDSFFDVWTEVSLDGGASFRVDSFFDVFVEVRAAGREDGTWDTEILSLDLHATDGPPTFQLRLSPRGAPGGHQVGNIGSSGQDGLRIDSFFDIWTELSVDGGQTWHPATSALHCPLGFQTSPTPSFGGRNRVTAPPAQPFPLPGSRYVLAEAVPVLETEVSLQSLTLAAAEPLTLGDLPRPGTTARIDSFFDVWTELSVDGGRSVRTDRVRRVPVQLWLWNSTPGASKSSHFQTEMVSLSLSGGSLPDGVLLRESRAQTSGGSLSIEPRADGSWTVDSFFDVWVELSVDGGGTWQAGDQPLSLTLHAPAASRDERAWLPVGASYDSRGRTTVAKAGVALSALTLRSRDHGVPGPVAAAAARGDSFFDIFTELRADGQAAFVDSFFDVFTELRSASESAQRTDSFFDVFTDLRNDTATHRPDSFFDVFVEVAIADTSATPDPCLPRYDVELRALDTRSDPHSGPLALRLKRPPRTHGHVTVLKLAGADNDFMVDSFFDVFVELSPDHGQTWIAPAAPAHVVLELPPTGGVPVAPEALGLPLPGRYASSDGARSRAVDVELVSLSLTPSAPVAIMPIPPPRQTAAIDSFFDVVAVIGAGDTDAQVRQVRPEVPVGMLIHGGPGNEEATGDFDTEMVSLSLRAVGPSGEEIDLREAPERASTGRMTVTPGADGSFRVDSFFDVWVEVRVDGGSWTPLAEPVRLDLIPYPRLSAPPGR